MWSQLRCKSSVMFHFKKNKTHAYSEAWHDTLIWNMLEFETHFVRSYIANFKTPFPYGRNDRVFNLIKVDILVLNTSSVTVALQYVKTHNHLENNSFDINLIFTVYKPGRRHSAHWSSGRAFLWRTFWISSTIAEPIFVNSNLAISISTTTNSLKKYLFRFLTTWNSLYKRRSRSIMNCGQTSFAGKNRLVCFILSNLKEYVASLIRDWWMCSRILTVTAFVFTLWAMKVFNMN